MLEGLPEQLIDEEDKEETNRILSNDYGSVAYDEQLDYYIELSYDKAKEQKQNLIEETKEDVISVVLLQVNREAVFVSFSNLSFVK